MAKCRECGSCGILGQGMRCVVIGQRMWCIRGRQVHRMWWLSAGNVVAVVQYLRAGKGMCCYWAEDVVY